MRWGGSGGERGSGTLLALIGMAMVVLGVAATWAVADLVGARQRAAVAADLAALAGAPWAGIAPEEACRRADLVLHRNDAVPVSCVVEGGDLLVTAGSPPRGIAVMFAGDAPLIRVTARATVER